MPRQPAHVLQAGRQAAWEQMRSLDTFRISDLVMGRGVSESTIRTYIKGLLAAGVIEEVQKPASPHIPGIYRLVKRMGKEAPRIRRDGTSVVMGSGRENMWRTMRILKIFSPRDLAIQASTEEHPVAESEANHYIRYLREAGYLAIKQEASSGRQAIYRFIPSKFTGPKPPMVQRVRQVYDPNLQKVVWTQDAGHVD